MEVKLEDSHEELSLHGEENTPKPLMKYLKVWFFLAVLNCSLKASSTSFGDAYVALTGEQGWMQGMICQQVVWCSIRVSSTSISLNFCLEGSCQPQTWAGMMGYFSSSRCKQENQQLCATSTLYWFPYLSDNSLQKKSGWAWVKQRTSEYQPWAGVGGQPPSPAVQSGVSLIKTVN